MIKPPSSDVGRPNNVIYFRRALFGSRINKKLTPRRSHDRAWITDKTRADRPFDRRFRPNCHDDNVIDIKQAFLSQRRSTLTEHDVSLTGLTITDEARHYIRTQYVRLITRALKKNDATRLSTLYGKYSFKMMRAEDKLWVVTEIFRLCDLEDFGGKPTAGLSLCFTEGFRGGHGSRSHFHDWIRLSHKSLKIQTLERFAMARGLNDEIRSEANAVLVNSYIRAAEDLVIARRHQARDRLWLDELVEKAIAVLARFKPDDRRLCAFADRILRINRIRFDSGDVSASIPYIFSRSADKPLVPRGTVMISLMGL